MELPKPYYTSVVIGMKIPSLGNLGTRANGSVGVVRKETKKQTGLGVLR